MPADVQEEVDAEEASASSDSSSGEEEEVGSKSEEGEKPKPDEKSEEGEKPKPGEKSEEGEKPKPGEKSEEGEKKSDDVQRPPVPYHRFAKAIADKNEALDQVETLQSRLAETEKYLSGTRQVLDFSRRLVAAKDFDPKIRELFQTHWLFLGREPTDDDIDNVRAYGNFLAEEKALTAKSETEDGDDAGSDDSETAAVSERWEKEEQKLASDPELKDIVTPERLIETYREIMKRGDEGENVSRLSFEKVFRDMWFDDIAEAKKEAGRREAASKMAKKKPAPMKPGSVSTPKPKDLSRLPLEEHIAAVVRSAA